MTHDDISDTEIEAVAEILDPSGRSYPASTIRTARAAILASRAALLTEGRKVVEATATAEMCDAATAATSTFLNLSEQGIELRRRKHAIRFRAMWDAAP